MLPESDPFSSSFKKTFEANYHPHIFQHEADLDSLTPTSPPFSFYDRHIGSHVVLKNIVYYPSLISSLSKTCEQAVQRFLKAGYKFSNNGYNFSLEPRSAMFHDAHSVSNHYLDFAGELCSAYASKFTLHSECQNWDSVIEMDEELESRDYRFTAESWLEVTSGLAEQDAVVAALPEPQREEIKGLLQKFPRLATWDVFAMTHTATSMLQTLRGNVPFKWKTCQTLGCSTVSNRSPPLDARKGSMAAVMSKASRPSRGGSTKKRPSTTNAKVVTVPKLPRQQRKYRPNFCHYIQHAWARAAMYDSTFIILHCGRYERIGFRHRASQTLYLSGIIDTINIKNPSYRKLHIGLHTAIMQDALERQRLLDEQPKNGRKRGADHLYNDEIPSSKRQKSIPPSEVDTVLMSNEIAKRKLVLVKLDYGAFCSPAPSSFLRIAPSCFPGHAVAVNYPKQTRYNIHEYISVTLKEPLGRGAVGIVHPAVVELTLNSGEILKHHMAIKLAFTSEQRKKIHNEYMMYGYLSNKDVEGIITVHGIFKDPESGALGMLMDDAGQSLRRREIERGADGQQVSTTVEERKAFVNALKSLHKAGVRHHDIRADNLLISPQNKAFIIDLDCADHDVREKKLEHELRCLNELLEGRYRDGAYYT